MVMKTSHLERVFGVESVLGDLNDESKFVGPFRVGFVQSD